VCAHSEHSRYTIAANAASARAVRSVRSDIVVCVARSCYNVFLLTNTVRGGLRAQLEHVPFGDARKMYRRMPQVEACETSHSCRMPRDVCTRLKVSQFGNRAVILSRLQLAQG
jgi:hypothetical protein